MRTVLFPDQEKALGDWLETNRQAAFAGKRENKLWKEWWCVREAYKRQGLSQTFGNHFCVEALDDEGGTPDFRAFSPDHEFFLEVTEATVEEDRRAKSALRNSGSVPLLGEPIETGGGILPGGRFRGGVAGDAYELAQVQDILEAISRKSKKPYARDAVLIVYANSNAKYAEAGEVFSGLQERAPEILFQEVLALVGGDSVIRLSCSGVELIA